MARFAPVSMALLSVLSSGTGGFEPGRRSAGAPVVPALPELWSVHTGQLATIDYAASRQVDAWLRHPILGDPSFDAFVRTPGNPIVRGEDPFRWPVNGSLFRDPSSGLLYAYVGYYHEGYALGNDLAPSHCKAFRSEDKGRTWTPCGPVFTDPEFRFEGDDGTANLAPDVSVVYADGLYHMAYDWANDATTWATAANPLPGQDGGAAYAWAERPEGPFHRAARPILRTSELQRLFPGETTYRRPYATTLIRRKNDWLVLIDADSGAHYAWGQYAMTATVPTGPWSKPVLVSGLETDVYFPSPVEGFPAFVHEGYVYNPKTSVGATRNYQLIVRAPVEQAHLPEAWELWQHGSVWHAEWVPDEGFGIWGQTFAGSVDPDGTLSALFPSRHWPDSVGTINMASRPWSRPFRDRGFVISAHSRATLTRTRTAYADFSLNADLMLRGSAVRIAWACTAPLEVTGRADGYPDPITRTRHQGLELTPTSWRLLAAGESGDATTLEAGEMPDSERRALRIEVTPQGHLTISIDGTVVVKRVVRPDVGALALFLDAGSNLTVERFEVTGTPLPATLPFLAGEAIGGAGIAEGTFTRVESPLYRFGRGVVCSRSNERAKWNFRGRGFRLWSPRGPDFGSCEVLLNGTSLGVLDLRADREQPSSVVMAEENLEDGFHALVLRAGATTTLPLDCLEALQ